MSLPILIHKDRCWGIRPINVSFETNNNVKVALMEEGRGGFVIFSLPISLCFVQEGSFLVLLKIVKVHLIDA